MPSCYMHWLIFNVLSAALQADSVCQIRNVSAVSLPGAEETAYLLGQEFYEESLCFFFGFLSFKHLNICGWCHKCVFVCSFIWCHCLNYVKAFAQPRPAAVVPYSIFFWPHELCILPQFEGRCLSLYLLTHSATGSFWKSAHGSRQPDRSGVKINDPQPNV